MKRLIMFAILVLLCSISTVYASPYSGLLPGGTNYLEEDNLLFTRDSMSSIDSIRVHSNQDYTLWFPPTGLWEYPYVLVTSGVDTLLDGFAHELADCVMDQAYTYCTFQPTNDTVDITITSQGIGQYYDMYGMVDIQMEEGTVPTTYETYIPPVTDVNGPEFSGTATFVKSYEETISITDIINNHIYVYDEIDGDVTSSIVVTNDTYTANMHTLGTHSATLTASDSSGNETTMTLNVLVKDEIPPEIEGPLIVSVGVDNPPAVSQILEELYTATDGYDGQLSIYIITDDYSVSTKDVGGYQVYIGAEDSSGNTTTKAILIDVKDTIAPELLSSTAITHYTSENMSILDIVNNLQVSDNFNAAADITKTVLIDDYSGNETTPGNYNVQVKLRDLSDNITIVDLVVTIVDDVAPIISGPATLSLSYVNAPTLIDLLTEFTITDDVDTLTTDDLEIILDDYTTRTTETGSFDITMRATDLAGNQTDHTLTVTLVDDQGPTIYIDNVMVTVSSQASFAPQDALNMMISNNELEAGEYDIITVNDDYTDNRYTPGIYTYELQFVNQRGETFNKEFLIHVTDIEEPEEVSWKTTARHIIVYSATVVVGGIVLYRMKK